MPSEKYPLLFRSLLLKWFLEKASLDFQVKAEGKLVNYLAGVSRLLWHLHSDSWLNLPLARSSSPIQMTYFSISLEA